MKENLFETQYDVTKKSKLKKFYESNKILIFSSILVFIISLGSVSFYLESKEKKKILLSENYIQARVYLEIGDKNKATDILKKLIFTNDSTYSTLAFFLVLNQNLITDYKEISNLFEHLLANNKFEKELKNLLIYKKALFDSNFIDESELLETTKPLLTSESLWKPHTLLLLGDYFLSKREYLKAKEFYMQILNMKNLQKDFYDQAASQLIFITNE